MSSLLWDGHTTSYAPLHENEPTTWTSLAGFHDGLLPQSEQITSAAPERFRSQWNKMHEKWAGRIPFCSADPRAPNHVEIVTGVAARTSPGWALLVRGVANWPGGVDHVNLEGVIETDWYHAFLPTVIRLLRQNTVVRFHRRFPYAMLQLVPKVAYDRSTATAASVATSLADFRDDIWEAMVAKRLNRIRQSGDYLREQRKRGRDQ